MDFCPRSSMHLPLMLSPEAVMTRKGKTNDYNLITNYRTSCLKVSLGCKCTHCVAFLGTIGLTHSFYLFSSTNDFTTNNSIKYPQICKNRQNYAYSSSMFPKQDKFVYKAHFMHKNMIWGYLHKGMLMKIRHGHIKVMFYDYKINKMHLRSLFYQMT